MKINSFGQNVLRNLTFALFLAAIVLAATFAANAQAGEKPEIKQLFVAIDRKDLAEFKRLLAAGVDLKTTFGDAKATALHQAAATGTPEMLKILIGQINLNERDANNRTALFYATVGKNLENFKFLLRVGADLDQKDSSGLIFYEYAEEANIKQHLTDFAVDTKKMWAALKANDNATALRLITTGNASPNHTLDKMTPLMFAAQKGDAALFDKILNAGGEVSTFVVAAFPPYRTALDVAAETGNEVLVKKILAGDLGWRKTAIVSHALSAAIRGKRDNLIPVLFGAGANVNQGFDLTTPISAAVARGDAAILKRLIATGATKETLGDALDAAFAAPNSATVFQVLLDAGADVNQNIGGFSALTTAVEKGNIGILKLLINKGADQKNIQNAFVVAAKKSSRRDAFFDVAAEQTGFEFEKRNARQHAADRSGGKRRF